MQQPVCAVCGRPATIHDTQLDDGTAVTRHLCQEHGASVMPVIDLGPGAMEAAAGMLQNLSDAEKENFALVYRLTRRGT